MRIVIAGPAKTGNVWLKSLLASMYELRALGPKTSPAEARLDAFNAWVEAGRFHDGTVFHQHYDYSLELADAVAAVPAHLVTIIRDPYDAFVSHYFSLQDHIGDESRRGGARRLIIGKPLDDPDVLAYLRQGGFQNSLLKANEWLHSGRSLMLRYEDLHRDPIETLERLSTELAPATREKIARAAEECSAENLRKQGDRRAKHVRAAKVGDSKDRLTDAHLAVFREHYADLIRSLGYAVR